MRKPAAAPAAGLATSACRRSPGHPRRSSRASSWRPPSIGAGRHRPCPRRSPRCGRPHRRTGGRTAAGPPARPAARRAPRRLDRPGGTGGRSALVGALGLAGSDAGAAVGSSGAGSVNGSSKGGLDHAARRAPAAAQYRMTLVTRRPLRRSRPLRKSSSTRNARPTTSPPSRSTSSIVPRDRPARRQEVVDDEDPLAGLHRRRDGSRACSSRTRGRTRPSASRPAACRACGPARGRPRAGRPAAR